MAYNPSALTVIVSPTAAEDLWEIWKYNHARYSFNHAEEYEAFLVAGINGLSLTYDDGTLVEGFPELRGLVLKKRRRGDGHIVVYEVCEEDRTVVVHHLFHTKMDLHGRLAEERRDP